MLNKKIITNRVILLMLSMCSTMPMIATAPDENEMTVNGALVVFVVCSAPASVLIVCRHLSLLHMTTPAITLTFVGILIATMIVLSKWNSDNTFIESLIQSVLFFLMPTIVICLLFALITYWTSFDCALIVPVLYVIAMIAVQWSGAHSVEHGLTFLAICIFMIIAFNYAGFYIAQLIW